MRARIVGRYFRDRAEMTGFRLAMIFAICWTLFFAVLFFGIPDEPPDVQGHLFDSSHVRQTQ